MAPKGRPPGRRNNPKPDVSAHDALAALHNLGGGAGVVDRGFRTSHEMLSNMRERKQKYRADDIELASKNELNSSNSALESLAAIAGINVPNTSPTKQRKGHWNAWSATQILRACFTPVSAHAFGMVMGTGRSGANGARSVVAQVIADKQREAVERVFTSGDVEPWVLFSKMHDGTKLEVSIPDGTICPLPNAITTSTGSLVVSMFVQEDQIITPKIAEVVLHSPQVLDCETAESIFHATVTNDDGGFAFRHVLQSVKAGRVKVAMIIDSADSAPSNLKMHRLLQTLLDRFKLEGDGSGGGRCLSLLSRCDGHQLHLVALVPMSRSSVASAIFSSALLVRSGHNRFNLHRAMPHMVESELDFSQGGRCLLRPSSMLESVCGGRCSGMLTCLLLLVHRQPPNGSDWKHS